VPVPDEREPTPPAPAATLQNGWLTLSLTRLHFPPLCSDCGRPTSQYVDFYIRGKWGWLVPLLTLFQAEPAYVSVHVPVCTACDAAYHRAWRRARNLGLVLGFLAGLGAAALLGSLVDEVGKVLLLLLGGLFGPLVGYLFAEGITNARHTPLKGARYTMSKQTVSLRFRQPAYAEQVLAAVQDAEDNLREPGLAARQIR
jgi:hypothetical protein